MSDDAADLPAAILADHERMEALLRTMRDRTADRATATRELAALLVAHAEAEERVAYPALERADAADDEEIEHGEAEHSHINAALLALVELGGLGDDDDEFEPRVHELAEALNHHLDEEERDLLNPAREELSAERSAEVAAAFLAERRTLLDDDCGSIENLRAIQDADGLGKLDVAELTRLAAARDVEGRSTMTKAELIAALTA